MAIVMQKLDEKGRVINSAQVENNQRETYEGLGYKVHPIYDEKSDEYKVWKAEQLAFKKKKETAAQKKRSHNCVVMINPNGTSTQIDRKLIESHLSLGYKLHPIYETKNPQVVKKIDKVAKDTVVSLRK